MKGDPTKRDPTRTSRNHGKLPKRRESNSEVTCKSEPLWARVAREGGVLTPPSRVKGSLGEECTCRQQVPGM